MVVPQINDRYEFYDVIDLGRDGGKYLSGSAGGWVGGSCSTFQTRAVRRQPLAVAASPDAALRRATCLKEETKGR